jgi:7-cyano-7-deazaguanine reductase
MLEKAESTTRKKGEFGDVHSLGNGTTYEFGYNPLLLETFDNKHPEHDYVVHFECSEFTSLCPMTGQPDWATILIRYIPEIKMVESKSLKLYLNSFRNHGDFHEDVINIIMKDLRTHMDCRYIEVVGLFHPRGGIAIHPIACWGSDKEMLSLGSNPYIQTYAAYASYRSVNSTFGDLFTAGKHLR